MVSRRQFLAGGVAAGIGIGLGGFVLQAGSNGSAGSAAPGPDNGGAPSMSQPISVTTFGALGDGRTNDADALHRAVAAVNVTGGVLEFPPGTYYHQSPKPLQLAAGVTLSGTPGRSIIDFDAPPGGGFAVCCSVAAPDVTIDGLVIRRASEFSAVLLTMGVFEDFTLSRTVLVGNEDRFPGAFCHGIKIGDDARSPSRRLVLRDSSITTTHYGLFQTNVSTAETTDIRVERCTFSANRNTDLEFNSPNGVTRGVRIEECRFSDNDSPGFGVGLAHVEDAVITGNTFASYALEAVHVEDYSDTVVIRDNEFSACGLRDHSHVQIIGGSRNVEVYDNAFYASMNANLIYLVNALPGGTGPTVGLREPIAPFNITVRNNTFDCSPSVVPIYFQGVRGGSIGSNKIVGNNVNKPEIAFRFIDDGGTIVEGNTF